MLFRSFLGDEKKCEKKSKKGLTRREGFANITERSGDGRHGAGVKRKSLPGGEKALDKGVGLW